MFFRRNKAAIHIQRIQRGIKVRSFIRKKKWAVFKIQGYFKMKKIHEYYNALKKAALKIQVKNKNKITIFLKIKVLL